MSQTTIPLQFEQYLLDKITAGAAPNLDEFVFAYIPNLDPEQPIDRATGLPDESFIVHRQNVDQTARLNRNTLIYSVIVPSNLAPFTFNAMYLHDKNVPESCGLIVHKTDETKESGMATTKSVAQEYDGAAEIAGIHIDPATWQIDYHARLFGIDEEIRLTQLDKYGHTAFISGFNVVKLSSNDYRIDPGIVYVGGLRCELKTAVTRTVTAKPNGLYVDVVREGSTLSKWVNVPTIRVSNTPLSDYVDEQGYQHYVTRLAGVDASGNVQDWREWDIVSQTEAEEGTSAIRRFWSALRITQLISAWWNSSAMKTKLDGIQAGAQVNVATNLATTADATSRTVTSSTGTNAVLPAVSASAAGVMTVLQRAKLEGIQAGAQVNVATNLATTADATSRTVTSSTGNNAVLPAATTTVAGVMTASDKAKLNGIQAGAQVNRPLGSGAGQVCEGNDPRLSNARDWNADIVQQAEAEGGESSTPRKWTAQRVRQAISKWALETLGTAAKFNTMSSYTDLTEDTILKRGSFGLLTSLSKDMPHLNSFDDTNKPNSSTWSARVGVTAGINPFNNSYASVVRYERFGPDDFALFSWSGHPEPKFSMRRWKNGLFSDWCDFLLENNEQQIGVKQDYKNESENRLANIAYKNITKKPILVTTNIPSSGYFEVSSDGITWQRVQQCSGVSGAPVSIMIPVNWWYRASSYFGNWMELK
ncbi:phage tail protein [Vibrio metschnikovii]|uniref:phage tail-collar fiber domain-containing protein n=1 Tax=Vibrio metschnikovii TaxID=28172 RepID=UPI00165D8F47|nr:phage tail protein [Vibrio metschnikovii]